MVPDVSLSCVRCPSRCHISKTKQDRPIATIEHYYEIVTCDVLLHSDHPQTPRPSMDMLFQTYDMRRF